jgi:hypothetical protein
MLFLLRTYTSKSVARLFCSDRRRVSAIDAESLSHPCTPAEETGSCQRLDIAKTRNDSIGDPLKRMLFIPLNCRIHERRVVW